MHYHTDMITHAWPLVNSVVGTMKRGVRATITATLVELQWVITAKTTSCGLDRFWSTQYPYSGVWFYSGWSDSTFKTRPLDQIDISCHNYDHVIQYSKSEISSVKYNHVTQIVPAKNWMPTPSLGLCSRCKEDDPWWNMAGILGSGHYLSGGGRRNSAMTTKL